MIMYPAGNVSQQLMFLAYFLEVSMKKITIIITANDDLDDDDDDEGLIYDEIY